MALSASLQPDLPAVEDEVENLLAGLIQDAPAVRARAEDLLAAVLCLYGGGLRRCVELADATGRGEAPSVWVRDPLVAQLLDLHGATGAHPAPADVIATRRAGRTVDTVLSEMEGLPGEHGGPVVDALAMVVDLHGRGLGRLVELARSVGDERLVARMAGDNLVASLMLTHGLHPDPVDVRLGAVLEDLAARSRPVADVELVEVSAAGRARLRVTGNTPGDAWRLRLAVQRAIDEQLPDLDDVVIEGGAEPVQPASATIALGSLTVRHPDGRRTALGAR